VWPRYPTSHPCSRSGGPDHARRYPHPRRSWSGTTWSDSCHGRWGTSLSAAGGGCVPLPAATLGSGPGERWRPPSRLVPAGPTGARFCPAKEQPWAGASSWQLLTITRSWPSPSASVSAFAVVCDRLVAHDDGGLRLRLISPLWGDTANLCIGRGRITDRQCGAQLLPLFVIQENHIELVPKLLV
jgi:hypothetical protein